MSTGFFFNKNQLTEWLIVVQYIGVVFKKIMSIANFGVEKYCVIRTYSAGVHCGIISERDGTEVLVKNARRIHYWTEAFTLNEIALNGAGEKSRLSDIIPEILLTEVIEIIPCSPESREWLSEKKAHEIK